jgi:23S rRNA pseudouridine1911/1915/1917 synthase
MVRCRLITGRTHQIRVHLAARKWPIVGDAAYGPKAPAANGDDAATKFPRQALHSWRIAFRHPRTGRELTIEAPVPDDMKRLSEAIGLTK